MQREFRLCRLSLTAMALAWVGAFPLPAQEEDPFQAPGPTVAEQKELRSESPLAREPATPVELLEAVVTMVDIGRVDLARKYLEQLQRDPLTDETLLQLRDTLGTAAFLKIEQIEELQPLIAPVIEASNTALRNRAGDTDRIRNLIKSLRGSREDRSAALSELRGLGPLAVPTLIGTVAADSDAKLRNDVGVVLLEIGTASIPMLQAALNASEPRVQQFAAELLGRLRASQAAPDLYYLAYAPESPAELRTAAQQALGRIVTAGGANSRPVPSTLATDALVRRLNQAAGEQFRGAPSAARSQESVDAWEWNDDRQTVSLRSQSPDDFALQTGSRYAERAKNLLPTDLRARALDLAFRLAQEIQPETLFQPAPAGDDSALAAARTAGPEVVAETLREALGAHRPEVAAAAATVLGDLQAAVALVPFGDRPSPLLAALNDPDIRVQFAAAHAILKIGPKGPYRGARRVVEILKQATASNSGQRHAIVGEVSTDRAAELSGLLKELGFETLVAMSGREAFRAAAERTDVELIVLHPNLIRWPLSETLANLRSDSRTARIPVVVSGPSRLANRFQHPLPGQTAVTYSTHSESPEDLAFQIKSVLEQINRNAPTAQQQQWMRSEAIAALGQLASQGNSRLYDLVGTEDALAWAAAEPGFSLSALESLGRIGTRRAQNLIAEFILNSPVNDVSQRAREILDAHVAKNGLLLRRSVVQELKAGSNVATSVPR